MFSWIKDDIDDVDEKLKLVIEYPSDDGEEFDAPCEDFMKSIKKR